MPQPRKPRGPKPGSQSALRQRNAGLIVSELSKRGPTTQATLSRLTGLSTGTVSNIVKLLEQQAVVNATPTIESGRRALAIGLLAGGRLVAGIAIERQEIRIAVAQFDQTVLAQTSIPNERGNSPIDTLQRAKSALIEALEANGLAQQRLLTVGISIAMTISRDSTLLTPLPLMPEWEGLQICELATEVFGVPCVADNDANLAALAQVTFGPYKDTRDLAYVKVSAGIGAGIIMDSQIIRGSFGAAGEIGHTLAITNGELCSCGARGCLATVAASEQVAIQLGRVLHSREAPDEAAVVALAKRRDPATLQILATAGDALGVGIATLCALLNPAVVIIGGGIMASGPAFIDPIYRAFHRHSLPELARKTTLSGNQLGVNTEALGAIALAMANSQIPTL